MLKFLKSYFVYFVIGLVLPLVGAKVIHKGGPELLPDAPTAEAAIVDIDSFEDGTKNMSIEEFLDFAEMVTDIESSSAIRTEWDKCISSVNSNLSSFEILKMRSVFRRWLDLDSGGAIAGLANSEVAYSHKIVSSLFEEIEEFNIDLAVVASLSLPDGSSSSFIRDKYIGILTETKPWDTLELIAESGLEEYQKSDLLGRWLTTFGNAQPEQAVRYAEQLGFSVDEKRKILERLVDGFALTDPESAWRLYKDASLGEFILPGAIFNNWAKSDLESAAEALADFRGSDVAKLSAFGGVFNELVAGQNSSQLLELAGWASESLDGRQQQVALDRVYEEFVFGKKKGSVSEIIEVIDLMDDSIWRDAVLRQQGERVLGTDAVAWARYIQSFENDGRIGDFSRVLLQFQKSWVQREASESLEYALKQKPDSSFRIGIFKALKDSANTAELVDIVRNNTQQLSAYEKSLFLSGAENESHTPK